MCSCALLAQHSTPQPTAHPVAPVLSPRGDRLQPKRIGVRIVIPIAAGLGAEESRKMKDLRAETQLGESLPRAGGAQQVPMILVLRSDDVLRNLVHLEEAGPDVAPRDPADFAKGKLYAFQGKMLKQIMHGTKVEA